MLGLAVLKPPIWPYKQGPQKHASSHCIMQSSKKYKNCDNACERTFSEIKLLKKRPALFDEQIPDPDPNCKPNCTEHPRHYI